MAHEDTLSGYILPIYETSQQIGCPTDLTDVSTVAGTIVPHSGLKFPEISDDLVHIIIKPADTTLH